MVYNQWKSTWWTRHWGSPWVQHFWKQCVKESQIRIQNKCPVGWGKKGESRKIQIYARSSESWIMILLNEEPIICKCALYPSSYSAYEFCWDFYWGPTKLLGGSFLIVVNWYHPTEQNMPSSLSHIKCILLPKCCGFICYQHHMHLTDSVKF